MSEHLEYLLEVARSYRLRAGFPEEERAKQVRSFAYGNTNLENENITKGDIDKAVDTLRSEREHSPSTICT